MRVNQGDLYWIYPPEAGHPHLGSLAHPYVIVQDNLFNHSRIHTVVVCALSTNLQNANAYGNLLLDPGEAHLPKQSVVVVSKIASVEKEQLGDYIGTLSAQRVEQILAGIRFLQSSFQR